MTEYTTAAATTQATATIELLGKSYQIKCKETEIPALQKAAAYLNNTMKTLPQAGRPLAPEKLGIMAALNLASQILELEQQMSQHLHFLNQRLSNLEEKLDSALLDSDSTTSFHLEIETAQV